MITIIRAIPDGILTRIAIPDGILTRIAIPVGYDLFSNIQNGLTDKFDKITQGSIKADIGIPCIVNDEQYFWYQFWLEQIIRITFDGHKVFFYSVDDTWCVANQCIHYNGARIKPYAEFFSNRNKVALRHGVGQGACADLHRFVALSMAMNDSVLY